MWANGIFAQTGNDFLRTNPKFIQAFREVIQKHNPSVVRIQCDGRDTCLGVVIGADGLILSKAHDLNDQVACRLHDGRTFDAKVVGISEANDLALLRIPATSLRVLPLSDSRDVKAGSWVASLGTGPDPAAIGIVSVPTRKMHEAFLGLLADATPQGLMIVSIGRNSAAHKAGLKTRDIIVSVDKQKVSDADHFQQLLGEYRPGDAVAFKIQRGNLQQDVIAILHSREQVKDFRSEFQNRLGSDLSNRRSGYAMVLQHDSVLRPSDCGGPVVDLKGRVVGINISRAGRVETWALPAEFVQGVIGELKAQAAR